MIALTQEKREELIACANEIKKMATSTHGYKVGNDAFGCNALMLMEVALASLTAEYKTVRPFGLPQILGEGCWVECDSCEEGATQLFTAPPVPEIKFIEPADFIRKWNNSDDCPLAGLSAKSAANKAVSAYAQEIKRLSRLRD